MNRLDLLSIEQEVAILRELLNGVDKPAIRRRYRLKSEELQKLLHWCVPGFESALPAQRLTTEQQEDLSGFLNVVEALASARRKAGRDGLPLILEARLILPQLLEFHRFRSSQFVRFFGNQCLNEWKRDHDRIVDQGRLLFDSPLGLPLDEAISLIETLEKIAQYFPVGPQSAMLPTLGKQLGYLHLSRRDLRKASESFRRGSQAAHRRQSYQQALYLKFLEDLTAFRATWKELDLPSATAHFHNTLSDLVKLPLEAFPKGFYWDPDDLKRDELLLKATAYALAGDLPAALVCLDDWLVKSKGLALTSGHYPRVQIRELTFKCLASSSDIAATYRSQIRRAIASDDLTFRADLYCLYLVDAVKYGAPIESIVRQVAGLIPRDADVPDSDMDKVQTVSIEIENERATLPFLPKWLGLWLRSNDPLECLYGLQAYLCCLAEYYSEPLGLTQAKASSDLDWAWNHLEVIAKSKLRNSSVLSPLLAQLEQVRAQYQILPNALESYEKDIITNLMPVLRQSALTLFPHVVRCNRKRTMDNGRHFVELNRVWSKQPTDLTFEIGEEEVWLPGSYYYLHPRLNFHQLDRLQRDPGENFAPVPARTYGAPDPIPSVLVVEGPTEEGLFSLLLDRVYPFWRALNIHMKAGLGAGGTFMQTVETVATIFKEAQFLVAYDQDAIQSIATLASQPKWKRAAKVLSTAEHHIMSPDTEGVDPNSTLKAIQRCWPRLEFRLNDVLPALRQYVDDVKSGARKPIKGGTLAMAATLIQRVRKSPLEKGEMWKSKEWGECLASSILELRSPLGNNMPLEFQRLLASILIKGRGIVITPETDSGASMSL